ncbi:MAG: T9SS type A sorting domain-containing protein, partial [Xanthomarina sp.]
QMTTQLADHPSINNGMATEEIVTFIPTVNDVYYFGFHAYSDAGQWLLYLDDISIVESALSINDNNMLAGSRLYPNPLNDGTFYVHAPKLNGEQVQVNITDMAGRQIFNNTLAVSDNKVTVSVNSDLTSGVYLVTLKHAGESHTFRLVKK